MASSANSSMNGVVMIQILRLLALLVVFLGSAMPVSAVEAKLCTSATPADAQLDKYPIASGPLSVKQMADLGLRPTRLQFPFVGYNLHREINQRCGGTWTLETIPAGEMVLVGKDGYVAYRISCGNRLVWAGKPTPLPPAVVPAPIVAPPAQSFPRRVWNNLWYWGYWRSVVVKTTGPAEVQIWW